MDTRHAQIDPEISRQRLPDQELVLQHWLASFPRRRAITPLPTMVAAHDGFQAALFTKMIDDLEWLKDLFGYEAVYFGIGCVVFPDAVDPSQGNAQ